MKRIYLLLLLQLAAFTPFAQTVTYCAAGALTNSTQYEKILRVSLVHLDNSSASGAGYEDFTSVSTTLNQGSVNNMSVTLMNAVVDDQILVWIDYNQDGDFTDAGEAVYTSAKGLGPFNFTVAVPWNAKPGATRMRVRLHEASFGPNSTPCGNSSWGQVEDYTVTIVSALPYCAAGATSTNNEKINRVVLGSINNASASGAGYEDFTNLSTILAPGSVNTMSVTGLVSYPFHQVLVWIDFNQDGDLDDAGEAVYTSAIRSTPFNFTIAVPAGAKLGSTRMRVRMHDTNNGPNSTPCGNSDYGQVEDYTVNIASCSLHTYYKDSDGDGFGNAASAAMECSATPPAGYVTNNSDCDDGDGTKHSSFSFYADHDGDTYGTGTPVNVCAVDGATPPTGYALNNTDCDDNEAAVHTQFSFYLDSDGDGYGAGSPVLVCAVDANTPPAGYSTIAPPCTGTLALGNAVTSNAGPVCSSISFTLSVNPAPVASDITYQWQVSTTGASEGFTDISGQTTTTATITGQSQRSWYRLKSLCTRSGQSDFSSAVQVTQQAAANCYCTPEIGYDNSYGYINSVLLGTIKNVSGQNVVPPLAQRLFYFSYVSAPAANQTTILPQASSQTITIDVSGSLAGTKGTNSVAAWIDFNADGDFYDAGEQLGTAANLPDGSLSFTFNVPDNAVLGPTRLRIRESLVYGSDPFTSPRPVTDPCNFIKTYGESEDYSVTIGVPCNGTNITYYRDADGDGFGNRTITQIACSSTPPSSYVTDSTDCDDTDPNAHASYTLYKDNDHDGFGNPKDSITLCSNAIPPTGYVTDNSDCDDTQMLFADADGDGVVGTTRVACGGSPNAGPDCNDNDPNIKGPTVFFADVDKDGYGNPQSPLATCSTTPPPGYVTISGDCNDNDAAVHESHAYFADVDGDSYGDPNVIQLSCSSAPPSGYVADNTDCDDTNAKINPKTVWYVDADGDGYYTGTGVTSCTSPGTGYKYNGLLGGNDCDDAKVLIHTPYPFYVDADGDTYGSGSPVNVCAVDAATPPTGYALNKTDCDDNDKLKWQSATIYIDNDGDGYDNGTISLCYGATVPQGYSSTTSGRDCNDNDAAIRTQFSFYVDSDGDSYGEGSAVSVCVANAHTPPAGFSINNTDCAPSDATKWQSGLLYVDTDGDGYTGGTATSICYGTNIPAGYAQTSLGTDCNDNDASKWQSATLYTDQDRDGYDAGKQTVCYGSIVPTGYSLSTKGPDCNDSDPAVHASGQFYVDADGDGYGTGVLQTVCYSGSGTPTGYSTNNTDCAPSDHSVWQNCAVIYTLSINDVSMNEGNKGKSNMSFTVSLNKASTKKVTVRYTTQNGTATAGSDYTAKSGTLTFKPGSTKQSVAISIIGDKTVEPNETFTVVLSTPISASLMKGTGTGTIVNDDGTTPVAARAVDVKAGAVEVSGKLTVTVSPNPSPSYFTLHIRSGSDKPLQVRTIDVSGRQIESQGSVPANGTLRLGENYRPGVYFTEVIQGSNRVILRLIKQIY